MEIEDLSKIVENFVTELELAEKGEKSSLSFIENKIPEVPLVGEGEIFQVMEIGGTNLKSAIVKKEKGNLILSEIVKETLPIFSSKEILFSFISQFLNKDISVLAMNFGFPQKPFFENGRLDGVLIKSVKDHEFFGLVGEKIALNLEKYLLEKFNKKIIVSVANDAVCLLLSGLTKKDSNNLAAGIVGTGFNAAIFKNPTTLVNLEAGNFDKFVLSHESEIIDLDSTNTSEQLFEKEVGGGYLYKKLNVIINEKKLKIFPLKSGDQLNFLAKENNEEMGKIVKDLFYRSAQLAASAISGIMEFQKRNLTFVMQGSVFWEGFNYKEMVEENVKQLSTYKAEFIKIENAGILGAAKLVG
ncbi:MAG TPA: hypothetical protein VF189_03575 [Patescibacteria group bacterium]